MNTRMRIFLGIAALLVLANLARFAGIFKPKSGYDSGSYNAQKLNINFQQPGQKEHEKAARNLFNTINIAAMNQNPAQNAVKITSNAQNQKPASWPQFKVTGIASSEGKQCAFLSGADANGMVYEGDDIKSGYAVTAISAGQIEIINKNTNERKVYYLEVK